MSDIAPLRKKRPMRSSTTSSFSISSKFSHAVKFTFDFTVTLVITRFVRNVSSVCFKSWRQSGGNRQSVFYCFTAGFGTKGHFCHDFTALQTPNLHLPIFLATASFNYSHCLRTKNLFPVEFMQM